jgi:hypothetical protein
LVNGNDVPGNTPSEKLMNASKDLENLNALNTAV